MDPVASSDISLSESQHIPEPDHVNHTPDQVPQITRWVPTFTPGKPFSGLMIASRDSGKSYLLRHLISCYLRDKYDYFLVVCSSPDEVENYESILPAGRYQIDREFNEAHLKELVDFNTQRFLEGKKMLDILVFLDDSIGSDIKASKQMQKCYCLGRHEKISVIYLCQTITQSGTSWRSNSDLVWILRNHASKSRKIISENLLDGCVYLPDGTNEKRFYQKLWHEHASKQGDCIVIDFLNQSNADNKIYWYRAPDEEPISSDSDSVEGDSDSEDTTSEIQPMDAVFNMQEDDEDDEVPEE